MRNIKITIEYHGRHFAGWQLQPGERTVQGEIEKALKKIFKTEIRIVGSGRTDTGVHAIGQVANFKTISKMETEEIVRALNGNLPDDIVILQAVNVPLKFHAQFSAKRKTYRYTVLYRRARTVLQKDYCHHIPHKLNLPLIRQEAKGLLGKKDFHSFMATDTKYDENGKKDTVRTVYKFSILKKGDFLIFEITANGFLYKMVRNMVGTLLDIGSNAGTQSRIKDILRQKSRLAAGVTAPAKGLVLVEVIY